MQILHRVGPGGAPPARAHDSLAPPGALHNWLPPEDWVYRHWVPFDERRLKLRLGLRGRQLEAHPMNDHRTLAQLARARGLRIGRPAANLVEPMRAQVDHAQLAVLGERGVRVLKQGPPRSASRRETSNSLSELCV